MTTVLKHYHIAEFISCKFFEYINDDNIGEINDFVFYKKINNKFKRCNDIKKLKKIISCGEKYYVDNNTKLLDIETELGKASFDGAHGIDVSVISSKGVFPFEVKGGETGNARSFPTSFEKWLRKGNDVPIGNNGIVGSMINVLEKHRDWTCPPLRILNPSKLTEDESTTVNESWGLILRQKSLFKNKEKVMEKSFNSGSFKRLEVIITYEQILKVVKDNKKLRSSIKQHFDDNLEELL